MEELIWGDAWESMPYEERSWERMAARDSEAIYRHVMKRSAEIKAGLEKGAMEYGIGDYVRQAHSTAVWRVIGVSAEYIWVSPHPALDSHHSWVRRLVAHRLPAAELEAKVQAYLETAMTRYVTRAEGGPGWSVLVRGLEKVFRVDAKTREEALLDLKREIRNTVLYYFGQGRELPPAEGGTMKLGIREETRTVYTVSDFCPYEKEFTTPLLSAAKRELVARLIAERMADHDVHDVMDIGRALTHLAKEMREWASLLQEVANLESEGR